MNIMESIERTMKMEENKELRGLIRQHFEVNRTTAILGTVSVTTSITIFALILVFDHYKVIVGADTYEHRRNFAAMMFLAIFLLPLGAIFLVQNHFYRKINNLFKEKKMNNRKKNLIRMMCFMGFTLCFVPANYFAYLTLYAGTSPLAENVSLCLVVTIIVVFGLWLSKNISYEICCKKDIGKKEAFLWHGVIIFLVLLLMAFASAVCDLIVKPRYVAIFVIELFSFAMIWFAFLKTEYWQLKAKREDLGIPNVLIDIACQLPAQERMKFFQTFRKRLDVIGKIFFLG